MMKSMVYAVITRCFMDYLPAALQLPIQSNKGELNVNETEYMCIYGMHMRQTAFE